MASRRAPGVVEQVRGRVSREVNARKDKATEQLDSLAGTVRRVGEPLQGAPYAPVGRAVERAASQLEQLAEDLRDRSVEQLVGDLARERPAVFVGAGLATGLLVARFLKSSGERPARPARSHR